MVFKILGIVIALVLVFYLTRYILLRLRTNQLTQQSGQYSHDYFVGNKHNPLINYIVLGDSTAEGTGSRDLEDTYSYLVAASLAQSGQYVHVLNYAFSGARSSSIPNEIAKIKVQPDIITLSFGANDATHGIFLSTYRRHLETIKKALNQYPDAQIVLANTPDMGGIPALSGLPAYLVDWRAQLQNKVLNQVFTGNSIKIVDLYNDGRLDSTEGHKLYADDLFHPSSEGYAIWAKSFIKEINLQ